MANRIDLLFDSIFGFVSTAHFSNSLLIRAVNYKLFLLYYSVFVRIILSLVFCIGRRGRR